ncbi:potassium uptake protein, TrkH family [Thermaerobacter marianensis DSM 12885]|uniref:Potassium uptake protein, TrkH family n=1 Tax=Thermaerobacter marianensis (strain ATCC 700841 / DSM 12885 / JCM 10246 / 7p75a) TaxID=644966 RepID=E6SIU9_THEM7|nr:TrkH family potassium uptake protein [Thermaerobacter marianensis]ADU50944.1 potassium uptake protein, TrkH family [Thermaerobacter marianensis DSM 12885]
MDTSLGGGAPQRPATGAAGLDAGAPPERRRRTAPAEAREPNPARILALGFAGVILLGSVLLSLPVAWEPGQRVGYLDALFTATSAVCVTGLVVVNTAETFSTFGEMVILALIQVGGLGVMTMSTLFALLVGKRITFRERLIIQEAWGQLSPAGMVRLVQYVTLVSVAFEAAGTLLLTLYWWQAYDMPFGLALYRGFFHAVSAFNNAGFDVFDSRRPSLERFAGDPVVTLVIGGLIIAGGLGFTVLADLGRRLRHRRHRLSLHTRLVLWTTAALLVAGTVLVAVAEWSNPATLGSLPVDRKLWAAFFHAITPRTAGFNMLPMAELTSLTVLTTILLMFVGGSPAGTAGGIKTTTLALLLATVRATIRGEDELVLMDRRVPTLTAAKALALAVLGAGLVLVVTMGMLLWDHHPLTATLFEAVSAFGTVGLSLGITPDLAPVSKVLILLTMYAGRVGPLTLAVALTRRGRRPPAVRYPEERVLVG